MSEINICLPEWLTEYQQQYHPSLLLEEQMAFVIEASRLNISHQTGGPFAAAVFEIDSGKLVSLGVNMVTTQGLSVLHGEIVALMLAQRQRGNYDLGEKSQPALSLVTSTEPCAMCFGAIPWSGVKKLVTGASDQDARLIGFDEGPKLANWQQALMERGIKVVTDVLSEQACQVLDDYQKQGGHIYNSREGD
jgi:tRNA(Arg) A34 adenosine deaminase TadA